MFATARGFWTTRASDSGDWQIVALTPI